MGVTRRFGLENLEKVEQALAVRATRRETARGNGYLRGDKRSEEDSGGEGPGWGLRGDRTNPSGELINKHTHRFSGRPSQMEYRASVVHPHRIALA
jgi:hypothetical protein